MINYHFCVHIVYGGKGGSMQAFFFALAIGCLALWLFNYIIDTLVTKPEQAKILRMILLLVVVVWILFGSYLFQGTFPVLK
jgi:hypothetical protein